MVDSIDVGGGALVFGRSGHDDFLGSALQVKTGLFVGKESSGGLADEVDAGFSPRNGGRVLLREDLDLLAIDNNSLIVLLDGEGGAEVSGVVLEIVDEVVEGHEGVVDGFDGNLG